MLKINDKYKTLFEQPEDVRYYVITGGRGSGKSFGVGTWACLKTFENNCRVLYTRYTLTSAHISIIPEFNEKIEILNAEDKFHITKSEIINKNTNSDILFKGIKTSSGNQTANLKSLQGVSVWILDEAEELADEKTFDKIDLSIRSKDSQNIVILILNPALKEHWIYQRFFIDKGVEEGFNGVVDNTCYIHSTYLDNLENLSDSFLHNVEQIKFKDPDKYNHEILGGWLEHLDGVLFVKKELNYFKGQLNKEEIIATYAFVDVADTGEDYHSAAVGKLLNDNKIYIDDVYFTKLGTDVNVKGTADIINMHNVNFAKVENNFGGGMYQQLLQPLINTSTTLQQVRAKGNKHGRIMALSGFIKEHFVFRNDYEYGSDYDLFMRNLTQYLKDGKSAHDDAPDSLEGLAKMFLLLHSDIFQVTQM
jgi:PBSX family phage terminase large subunit